MTQKSFLRFPCFQSDNLKSEIENLKLVGLFALAVAFALCGAVADAQQPGKISRIGFLDSSTAAGGMSLLDTFRQELGKFGWNDGKTITIEYRFSELRYERLPELAADLVRLRVDLIVVPGAPPGLAAKSATTTIPIVMTTVSDPVGVGLVANLARPGGNITGSQV